MNTPLFFWIKVFISGFIIAAISTLAKKYPKWATLLTALPLMTYLSLIWIYLEHKDVKMIENYTLSVFTWVLPTLSFFIAAIILFKWKFTFYPTMIISTGVMILFVLVFEKLKWLK